VVIARDDYAAHAAMALPFLDSGLPVFVDKPLSLDVDELRVFMPYLRSGQLMSCSSVRYAQELDGVRAGIAEYGEVEAATGTVVNDWPRYGIHMLEGIFSCVDVRPISVQSLPASHEAMEIETSGDTRVRIDAIGSAPKIFRIDIAGSRRQTRHDIVDNFEMFKRTLAAWIDSIRTGVPAIPADDTLMLMRTLIAGQRSREQCRRVPLAEVVV
jgi:predicted dehydrogenase